jgi:hypothetical protein
MSNSLQKFSLSIVVSILLTTIVWFIVYRFIIQISIYDFVLIQLASAFVNYIASYFRN